MNGFDIHEAIKADPEGRMVLELCEAISMLSLAQDDGVPEYMRALGAELLSGTADLLVKEWKEACIAEKSV